MKTIFISSTFKDMHFERDIIHEKVMPELNEYAARYGESVSFCDLRWGVNTGDLENEEGSKKVLAVCLDEIDRCRPYMIVILGERYGWIPEEELIADAVQSKRDFALDELEKSVTALEIEYGALSRPDQLSRTLFYFREFTSDDLPAIYRKEDDRHEEKLLQLKERIRRLTGGRVKTYAVGWDGESECITGLDTFVELVTQDVKGLMEQEWQEYALLSPFERDQRAQWDMARQKSGQFAAREALVEDYIGKINGGQRLLALKGATGSGKSTLMARLAVRLSEAGEIVLPVFCGHTAMSNDTLDLIRYQIYWLEEQLGLPHQEQLAAGKELRGESGEENAQDAAEQAGEENAQDAADRKTSGQADPVQRSVTRLAELVAAYTSSGGKRLMILLDALDQLMPDDARDRLFFIPSNLSEKVQMVISCLDTFSLPGVRADEMEAVSSLEEADRGEVIRGILSFQGRELETIVIEKMAQKRASASPLYLSLLIQRLLMMNRHDFDQITAGGDGMAAISAHQLALLDEADDTLEGVCVDLLEAASARIGGGFVKTAARYMAVSRHGLRESDIESLLMRAGVEYNSLDFSFFIRYMRSFFILRDDGRYDFAHRSIREGILADCREDMETDAGQEEAADRIRLLHGEILAHLEGLKEEDPVRIREITYHACMAGDREFLVRYLTRYEASDSIPVREEILTAAAKDIHDDSLADGGALFSSLLEHRGIGMPGRELLLFVNFWLDDAFGISQKELLTEQRIAEAAIGLARELLKKNGTDQSRRDLTTCYYTMGAVCSTLGGKDLRRRNVQMYEEAFAIRKELYEKNNSLARKKSLAYAMGKLSYAYSSEESAKALEQMEALRRQRLALREEIAKEEPSPENVRSLSDACEDLGDAGVNRATKESLAEAYELYQRAVKLREELLEKEDTVSDRWRLADTCKGFGVVCENIGSLPMFRLADELFARAEELYVQTDRIRKSVSSRKDVAQISMRRGGLCTASPRAEMRERAVEYFRKAAAIYEQLMQELGTADSRDDVARSDLYLADALVMCGDQDSLSEAIVWYKRAAGIHEELAEELRTSESKKLLADAWHGMAEALRIQGRQKDYEEALQLCQKAKEIREELAAEQKTAASRLDLVKSMKAIGFLLMEMSQDFEEYMPYIRREKELLTEVDRELGTDESRQRLANVCFHLAKAYFNAGGEERLKHAEMMCREGICLQKKVAESRNTTAAWNTLVRLYMQAGKISATSGSRVSLERALDFYRQAEQVKHVQGWETGPDEECLRGKLLADMGDIYYLLGGSSDLSVAYGMYEEACAVFERQVKENGMVSDRKWLAYCCSNFALVCRATLKTDQKEKAEGLLLKAAALWEEIARQQGTASDRVYLAEAWLRLGDFYAGDSDSVSIRQAEELYRRAQRIWQSLKEEGNDGAEKDGLPACEMAIGTFYAKLGGDENNRKALSCIRDAREQYRRNLAEHRTTQNLRAVAYTWLKTGTVLKSCRGAEDFKQAEQAFLEALSLCAAPEAEPETVGGREYLAWCQEQLARLYELYRDSGHMQKALEGYQKAYALRKENMQEDDSVQNVLNAAMSCRDLGGLHYKLETEQDLRRSLALHEEEQELLLSQKERIGTSRLRAYLSGTCENLGNVLCRIGGVKNLARAREVYGQYLQMAKEIAQESALTDDARSVAVAYEKNGDICMETGTQEDLKEAVRLFGLEQDVWEQLKERLERLDYLRGIAIAWQKQGMAYQSMEEEGAAEQAAACIRRSLVFWQQLAEESGLIQDERGIAVCYERLGDLEHRKGETADDEALSYYRKEEEIWRRLIEALDTVDAKRGLSFTLGKQASVYQKRSGEESRRQEIKLREEKLSFDREVAEKLGTPKALQEYITGCRKLGKLLAEGDSREEKEQALALYQAYIARAEDMVQEGILEGEEDALCIAWQMTASLYRALGGEDACEQAAAAYQKALTYFAHEEGDPEESVEDRTDRMKICMNLASVYMTKGNREAYEEAFPYSEKACRIAKAFTEQTPTTETGDNYALCLMNHGRLCAAAGGEAHGEEGIACYKRAVDIAETIVDKPEAVYASQVLMVCSMSLGDLLKAQDADSEESLKYYRKGLAWGSRLAAAHGTVTNLDNYVVALYKVLIHNGTEDEEKYELAEQMRSVSEQMYARTGNPRHKRFADIAAELMEILTEEDRDADEADAGEDDE